MKTVDMLDDIGAVIALVVLSVLLLAFLAVIVLATIDGVVTRQAELGCLGAGFDSATVYPFRGEAYCHKTVGGTSITVPLAQIKGGE